MNHRILALSLLALIPAGVAHATTYFDTISLPATASGNADGPSDGATLIAQSFSSPGTPDFNSVTLALTADAPTDGGSFMVYLVPDDASGGVNIAGSPQLNLDSTNTTAIGFSGAVSIGTINDSQLAATGSSPTLVTLSIPSATVTAVTSLTANNEYWIGIDATGSTSVEWSLSANANGVGTAGQALYNNVVGGFGSANSIANGGYQMSVASGATVSPSNTPEPATLAIMGAGMAGIGFARRRRSIKA